MTTPQPTVTPEQVDAMARVIAGHPERWWAEVSERMKDLYRGIARRYLAAAGIEVTR